MKNYRIRKGSVADYAVKAAKPLGVLVVAGALLAAYSWAAADELQTYTMQAEEYEQVKTEYIEAEELASYEQVGELLETVENDDLSAEIGEYSANNGDKWENLGEFRVTAYCPCSSCCGFWADGITSCGAIAEEGITIAADTDVLPYGSKVLIDGHEYTVQDTGGAIQGNRIDIYFDSHQTAKEYGVQYHEVFVKETK